MNATNAVRSVILGVVTALCMLTTGAAWSAPSLEDYGRLPGVQFMCLSPAGDRYAFVVEIDGHRRLGVATNKNELVFAIDVDGMKIRSLEWSDSGHLLLTISKKVDQRLSLLNMVAEYPYVLNISVAQRKWDNVFAKEDGIAKIAFGSFGTATVDGHHYAYFAGLTYRKTKADPSYIVGGGKGYIFDSDVRDLYRVDLDSGQAKRVALDTSTDHNKWVIGPDGSVVAHSEYDEVSGTWRLYRGDRRDADALVTINAPLRQVLLAGLGRSAGTVLVVDESGDHDVVEEISIADGKRQELFTDQVVQRYLWDPDTKYLIGATLQAAPYAMFFDPHLQARFDGTHKAFPDLQMHLVDYSHGLDLLIVETDGGNDSGTYWFVNIATGSADPIGHERPQISEADVGPTQWFKYTAADGLPLEGVLTLPPGSKPHDLPLVMLPHGGPIGVRDSLGFDWWAQAFAHVGYAVFQPNYRGSGGYGKDFRQAAFGQWGHKMQTDLSDGVAALAKQGIVDTKRVCIVGGNYGGYAALAGVTLQHGIYRCAVSVAGLSDMGAFFDWGVGRHDYSLTNSFVRYWRAVTGEQQNSDAMRAISPVAYAADADAPILLIHGKDDTVVPFKQSEEMADALKRAGKPYQLIVMDGEDHWLSRDQTRIQMLKASVAFVEKYNPPGTFDGTAVAVK